MSQVRLEVLEERIKKLEDAYARDHAGGLPTKPDTVWVIVSTHRHKTIHYFLKKFTTKGKPKWTEDRDKALTFPAMALAADCIVTHKLHKNVPDNHDAPSVVVF